MKMKHLLNGKVTFAQYLSQFRQTPARANLLSALFYLSVFVVLYSMWTGPISFMLQNLTLAILVWYVDKLEKEITRRGPHP